MALETVQLDTLNWQQMVSAVRTRIIPDSRGKWTLHAPVDPGVTLLELFAWLLDQRIYWMDQVPDALLRGVLALLGEAPKPAQPATTVLQLSDDDDTRASVLVAAGTALRLGDSNPPLIFTLDQDLTLLPVQTISVSVDGRDYTNDLAQGRPVPLTTEGKDTAEVRISLGLAKEIPDSASGVFSLMLELDTPAAIPAQWSPSAVAGVPPPAQLAFFSSSLGGGTTSALQCDEGTGGLRRSGVLRIPLGNWKPETGSAGPPFTYVLSLQISGAEYTVPPSLLRVLPNVVFAHHRWPRKKQPLTKSWLPLPGNVISLPGGSPYAEFPPIEDTVEIQITERDGRVYDWKVVPDLSFAGPSDRVCVVDRVTSEIRFGDGLTGRLPVVLGKDDSEIVVTYQAGGGSAGNVGENLSPWVVIKENPADPDLRISAVNVVAGDGGQDPETVAAARKRAQAAINEHNRAVSKNDYENLAQTTPGVGFRRAYAALGYHPDFPCSTIQGAVTVFVIPGAPRDPSGSADIVVPAPQPDGGSLKAAQGRLDQARLVGSQVFVRGAVYRPVSLALEIAADSCPQPAVEQKIVSRLRAFLDPLIGGDNRTGWPFGDPLRPSALTREAQSVLGKAGDVLKVSVLLDGMDGVESCKDVPIRAHELLRLDHVDLHIQRRSPTGGGLR